MRIRPRPTLWTLATVAGLLFAACGGGGSGSTDFELVEVSVPNNGTWQINRPMLFEFTDDVDFSTVNLNTISIAQTAGAPAAGEFSMFDSKTVAFQPRCPTLDDFSDAGLLPGGVAYTIRIPGSTTGGLTVRSLAGEGLSESQSLHFNTPNSTEPSVLFLDTTLGPPSPVIQTAPGILDASYLELADDLTNRVYFIPRASPDPVLGADVPAGFVAGLNLYSDTTSHLAVIVAVNQPVSPSLANINVDTVKMQYRTAAGTWQNLAHTVKLVANCSGSGATVRVTPTGILPQNRLVRILVTRDFRDLVGDANLVDITVGTFLVTTATNPGTTTPGDEGDEYFEEFAVGGAAPGSFEDTSTVLADPRAEWGASGTLRAGFEFSGTGGFGGDFDWKIGNDLPPSPQNHPQILLDTSFSVITNEQQTAQQTVINGIVDIRDLHVTESGTLLIQGPNRCTILVSGDALIEGEITIEGNNNRGVVTLNTTNIPEPGASGKGGGGRGGAGSPLTTQSDPGGESGYGAFDAPGGGGVGGESGYQTNFPFPDPFDDHRRPAGGGGGSLGADSLRPAGINNFINFINPNLCPDQEIIGLDAENGFNGFPGEIAINPGDPVWTGATGALSGGIPPLGGTKGPRPFFDGNPNNDFWGTMRTQGGQLIRGELSDPWAGAGGGGGGDAVNSNSFPQNPYDPGGDEKGAGGGGGGGSLTILALGEIRMGPRGRIDASGGTGGGGESSAAGGITRTGGGSGGGSGGHIVLQTATRIDLSAVLIDTSTFLPRGGIYSVGGQGGAGKDDRGGAMANGVETTPNLDALPPNSYPSATAPCGVVAGGGVNGNSGYLFNNQVGNAVQSVPFNAVVIGCGGDGGPGMIQLHAPLLSDIIAPTTVGVNIYDMVRPPPIGSGPGTGVPSWATINLPISWNQMLPIFGRKSQALSKWIPLGGASVNWNQTVDIPDPIAFKFGGTTAAGLIATTGNTVNDLPPIFSGTLAAPNVPFIAADLRTLVVGGSALTDDIYVRNPALLRRFNLRLTHLGLTTKFEVGSATYDETTDELRLTVTGGINPLAGYANGDAVQILPRFFFVETDDVGNTLPASSQIVIEFQATTQNAAGDPNLAAGQPSAWVKDISLLNPNTAGHPDYRFIRFQVSFDISAQGAALTFDTPIPSLDFFRIPFRF